MKINLNWLNIQKVYGGFGEEGSFNNLETIKDKR